MFSLESIKHLELELSTHCNSFCPQCPRYEDNGKILKNLKPTHLNFSLIQSMGELPNLKVVRMCGGYGDPLMSPDLDKFIDHFKNQKISISTNASLRSTDWWHHVGSQKITVTFCIDGMADTHSLYRINTNYDKIMANAKTFIDAGGNAEWQMIIFKHNQHQVEECRKLSQQMGFKHFKGVFSDRFDIKNNFQVFQKGCHTHTLKKSDHHVTLREEFDVEEGKKYSSHIVKDYLKNRPVISCHWSKNKMIYIDAQGLVWPCCMQGTSQDKKMYQDLFKDIIKGFDKIDLNIHSLKEIIDGPAYKKYFLESLKSHAHIGCLEYCHPQFGKYYRQP